MKTAHRILAFILILAVALPVVVYVFLPMPNLNSATVGPAEYKIATATVVLFAWLHIGAVLLFLTGLSGFKQEFRRSYKAICLGLGLYGVSLLQFPVIGALNLWQSPWSVNGGKAIPLIIANIAIFAGLRLFANQLAIKDWGTNFATLLLAPLIALPAGLLVQESRRLEFIADMLCVVIAIILMILVWRIWRAAGAAYKKSLRWLTIVMAVNVVAQVLPSLIILFRTTEGAYITLPFAVAGTLTVVAGYSFNKIGTSLSLEDSVLEGEARAVDLLVYLASLASSPKDIDPIMDSMRFVTARASTNTPLSESDQQTLITVYNRLIAYLINQDPLRVYDKPLLDRKIRKRFPRTNAAEATFWKNVSA